MDCCRLSKDDSASPLPFPFSLFPLPSSRLRPLWKGQGVLLFGEAMRPLTAAAAAWGVAQGLRVLVVDAANRFDPYQLAREGRKRGLPPGVVLQQVQVARAFTCHQLVQLVQEGLPAALAGEERAMVIILGPCSLFYDEQVPLAERRRLFRTMLGALVQIKKQAALWFLQPELPPQVANQHFGRLLARLADQVIRVGRGADAAPRRQSLATRSPERVAAA
jgi:hypothetical protein